MNFTARSSAGIDVWQITNKDAPTPADRTFRPFFNEPPTSRTIAYSDKLFAYGNHVEVKIYDINYELKYTIPQSRSHIIKFSPKGNYLIVYEIYVSKKDSPNNSNLFIYNADNGKELISFMTKKHSEWEPFISNDESVLAIMLGGDVHFYEISGDAFTKTSSKLTGKVGSFSLSPGNNTHVAVYLEGAKGSPSMTRLFKYSNLDSAPVASKSFSQTDKVEMIWSKKGNGCLIMTTNDVDSTGASYYGKQALHFLATNGDSFSVPLKGEGPIHSATWSPKSNQFIVVYGYQPAKATLFNMKCDVVFDFGTGIRNCLYWNDFGNLVLFGAFGNLRGNIEMWDLAKKKQVSTSTAPDTTLLEWSPSGDLYFTATTTPRLRQGNGFKIWHYSGALLYEFLCPEKQELYELAWQKYPEGFWKEPEISNKKVEGIQSSQPQASDKKYVPPNIRQFGEDSANGGSSPAPPAQGPIPGLPPGYTSSTKPQKKPYSRGNGGNYNKKYDGDNQQSKFTNNQGGRKHHNKQTDGAQPAKGTPKQNDGAQPAKGTPRQNDGAQQTKGTPNQVGNGEKLQLKGTPTRVGSGDKFQSNMSDEDKKKSSAIRKKLKDIKMLKEKQEKGEKLDPNQLKKIATESDLNKDLAALKLS